MVLGFVTSPIIMATKSIRPADKASSMQTLKFPAAFVTESGFVSPYAVALGHKHTEYVLGPHHQLGEVSSLGSLPA